MNKFPLVSEWLNSSSYKYDGEQLEINRKTGSPKISLIDHNSYRCEDDQIEWVEQAIIEQVDVKEWNHRDIDRWLHDKGFKWKLMYRID